MLAGLNRIDQFLGAILRPVVFVGMTALTAVITLQIVSRVFFTSVYWTEEVARFLLIWITFLGAALAWQQARHLAVALLRDSLPSGVRRLITSAAILVSIAFMVALTIISIRYMTVQSFQKSPSLRISMSYIYAVMPIAAALMAALSLIDLARVIAGHPPRDAASDLPEES